MNTRLSVIIPGYKSRVEWWHRSVSSVLKATDANDEILCVNDGDPDSNESLEEIVRSNPRVKAVHRQNGGLSVARNTGMASSKGDFIAFVDSDDEISDAGIYRDGIQKLEATPSDICIYGVHVLWTGEHLTRDDVPAEAVYSRMTPELVQLLEQDNLLNYAWNKVYRASFLRENKLLFDPDGVPCEDLIFNLACSTKGARFCTLPRTGITYYRMDGTLVSRFHRSHSAGYRARALAWERFAATCEEVPEWLRERTLAPESEIAWTEWNNFFAHGCPYSFAEKYRWAKEHRAVLLQGHDRFGKLLRISPLLFTLARGLFGFLRRNFYIMPIRRWHLKRVTPGIREVQA